MDLIYSGIDTVSSYVGLGGPEKISPNNKYVLITGCDTGLGFSAAKRLDSLGYTVIAACLFPEGEGALKLVQETSNKLRIIGLDVTSDESCKVALVEVENLLTNKSTEHSAGSQQGVTSSPTGRRRSSVFPANAEGLHALINNAGMCVYGDFEWQKMEHCESVINVNLLGAIRVTKYFLPLITHKTGRIINVTSILGFNVTLGLSIYGATKAGLESFSHGLRLELHDKGISVCTIAPGLMTGATGLMKNSVRAIQEMWDAMTHSQKQENKARYDKLIENSKRANRSSVKADHILISTVDDIESCVSHVKPRSLFVPCDLTMRFTLALIQVVPTGWARFIINRNR